MHCCLCYQAPYEHSFKISFFDLLLFFINFFFDINYTLIETLHFYQGRFRKRYTETLLNKITEFMPVSLTCSHHRIQTFCKRCLFFMPQIQLSIKFWPNTHQCLLSKDISEDFCCGESKSHETPITVVKSCFNV